MGSPVARILRHPVIGLETLVDRASTRLGRAIWPPDPARTFVPHIAQIITEMTGISEKDYQNLVAETRSVSLAREINQKLRKSLSGSLTGLSLADAEWIDILEGLYVLARVARPRTIVETGVGIIGASTAYLSQAILVNGAGHLWSVDPNRFKAVFGVGVGAGVPNRLSPWHTIVENSSSKGLPKTLEISGSPGIFLHDGLHTYGNMLREFRTVWPRLTADGYLCSDDVNNAAIDEFASEVSRQVVACRYDQSSFAAVARSQSPGSSSARV